MDVDFINNLNIENVHQEKDKDIDAIFIYFDINEITYGLGLPNSNTTGNYIPLNVIHVLNKYKKGLQCPYCGKKDESFNFHCDKLTEYANSLFLKLIKFNSIRMYWLFMNQDEK